MRCYTCIMDRDFGRIRNTVEEMSRRKRKEMGGGTISKKDLRKASFQALRSAQGNSDFLLTAHERAFDMKKLIGRKRYDEFMEVAEEKEAEMGRNFERALNVIDRKKFSEREWHIRTLEITINSFKEEIRAIENDPRMQNAFKGQEELLHQLAEQYRKPAIDWHQNVLDGWKAGKHPLRKVGFN